MIIVGNVGRDPEMRYTPSGSAVTNFSVACNMNIGPKNADGSSTVGTVWFRTTVWGKQAETVNQYLKKGNKVLVQADQIGFDPTTGGPKLFKRQDGSSGASFEVTAARVRFLGGALAGQEVEGEVTAEAAPDNAGDLIFEE
jgi:single-strand DNA-binding protein